MPPRTPLPARHTVKLSGLWSRLSDPLVVGVRLNSPFQWTRIFFRSPRALRSARIPAMGTSTSTAFSSWSGLRTLCYFHCDLVSLWGTWTNLTPCSAKRLAMRYFRPKSSVTLLSNRFVTALFMAFLVILAVRAVVSASSDSSNFELSEQHIAAINKNRRIVVN